MYECFVNSQIYFGYFLKRFPKNPHKNVFLFRRTVAQAAHPSLLPVNPRCSVVVALTETLSGEILIVSPRTEHMDGMYPASFGFWRIITMSAFTTFQPRFSIRDIVRPRRILLSMPLNSSEVSGKCLPMSPRERAPSRASQRACMAASPSEWATQPNGLSIRTPPSMRGRPSARAWTSYPNPVL